MQRPSSSGVKLCPCSRSMELQPLDHQGSPLPFHFVCHFFAVHTVFSLMVHLTFLLALSVLLVSHPRNHCQDQCHEAFFLFFSRGFTVSGLIFMYLIYFELIFVYDVRSIQFRYFVYDCP